jgi:uncharacterized protein YceK
VRPTPALAAAALAVALSGCGTTFNLVRGLDHPDTEPRVYGGVAMDMEFLGKVANSGPSATEVEDPRTWAAFLALGCIDPAFSIIGDTLTLPITVPLQAKRLAANEKKNQDSANTLHTELRPEAQAEQHLQAHAEQLPEAPPKENAGP